MASIINAQIILVLCLWIIASFGYGHLAIKLLESFGAKKESKHKFLNIVDIKFNILFKGIMGIIFFSLLISCLHFFTAINAYVSVIFLSFGIAVFFIYLKGELHFIKANTLSYLPLIFSLLVGLSLAAILSIRVERAYDTGLYHIQAIKWIQEFPITFGIANIHTRLGYNNILYNFAALTEVSHIFPKIRSFLLPEIFAFFFFTSAFLSLYNLRKKCLNDIFMCMGFVILSIEFWWLGGGMYAEGILGIMGLSIVGYIIYMIEKTHQTIILAYLLLFVLAFFSIYIKISAIFLLICVIFVYFQYCKFSINTFRDSIWICVFCVALGIFWALKGICISGYVAYPAKIFYLESLPWAISEARATSEILTIKNWAKVAGTPNAEALLQDYSWLKVWFKLFFWQGEFKVILSLGIYALLFLILFLAMRWVTLSSLKPYFSILCALALGIVFWFFSAPDPRFGFQYFFPLFGFLLSFVLCYFLKHKEHYVLAMFFIYLCAHLSNHIHFKLIDKKEINKIPTHIHIQSKLTDSHMLLYYPKDDDRVYDAPLPSAPYFNKDLSKKTFLGRDMYYLQHKE